MKDETLKMEIGIIGMGDMGKLYAQEFSKKGYKVNVCDLPQKRSVLEKELENVNVCILDDGVAVSRRSDLIIYAVEAENIKNAVRQYGPSTRKNAIVAGQTSVKSPEIEAFEEYLPSDVNIVTCHPLHSSMVGPKGQALAVIKHRSSSRDYNRALETFGKLGSRIVEISTYLEHDRITADTQAVTHMGFESMGTAWQNAGIYPWENESYLGGIDNVKVLMCLRIFAGKPHVYAALAIMNPFAKEQVRQYAQSESELFKMMIKEDDLQLKKRIKKAGNFVFGNRDSPPLLDDAITGEFSLGISLGEKRSNSHLSLLAMIDAWHRLGVNPYDNLICQTPPFRLRLGIAEYLFRNSELLDESLHTALFNKDIRGDDLEFHTAVREWASIIGHNDIVGYKEKFNYAKLFFQNRLEDARRKSNELIKKLNVV